MNLNTFLKKFFLKLNKEKIQFCILRNHNSLPKKLISNDIDVLIEKKDIKKIESLINKYFIHFSVLKREYLTSFVIFDINSSNFKSLKIDFLSKISFKGLVYLDNKEIFNQSVSKSGCNYLKIPNIEHEAIICYFSSFLVGGWINKKYLVFVKKIFSKKQRNIKIKLKNYFDEKIVNDLIKSIKSNNLKKQIELIPRFQNNLYLTYLLYKPFTSIYQILSHYLCEVKIRILPNTIKNFFLILEDDKEDRQYQYFKKNFKNLTKNTFFKKTKIKKNLNIIESFILFNFFFYVLKINFFHQYKENTIIFHNYQQFNEYYIKYLVGKKKLNFLCQMFFKIINKNVVYLDCISKRNLKLIHNKIKNKLRFK